MFFFRTLIAFWYDMSRSCFFGRFRTKISEPLRSNLIVSLMDGKIELRATEAALSLLRQIFPHKALQIFSTMSAG